MLPPLAAGAGKDAVAAAAATAREMDAAESAQQRGTALTFAGKHLGAMLPHHFGSAVAAM